MELECAHLEAKIVSRGAVFVCEIKSRIFGIDREIIIQKDALLYRSQLSCVAQHYV